MTDALKSDRLILTDGGLETDMIFKRGVDLPHFASIALLQTEAGQQKLRRYYQEYLDLAVQLGTGFELVSATWRASSDWAPALGLSVKELDGLNRDAVQILIDLRAIYETPSLPILISGCVGPRGDGYDPGKLMSAGEAEIYHARQIAILADAGVDMVSAVTMTNVPEAIGAARAARTSNCPIVVSFTVETDGRLPGGDLLADAIDEVDQALASYPMFYMVNCAHPDHFADALAEPGGSIRRLGGIRANASRCSHAELDAMTELDDGDPTELAELYRAIRERHPQVRLLGGCCGTDIRHISAIGRACVAQSTPTDTVQLENAARPC